MSNIPKLRIRLRHFTIRLDSHVTSKLDSHGVASRKSTSGMTNRQQGKRFVSIRWNRVHELISSLSNRKYQRRIDSSWVYWKTLENLNDFNTYRKRQSYILLTSPNSRRQESFNLYRLSRAVQKVFY